MCKKWRFYLYSLMSYRADKLKFAKIDQFKFKMTLIVQVKELGHFYLPHRGQKFEGCFLCKMLCSFFKRTSDKAKPVRRVRNLHLLKQHCEKSRPSNLGVGGKINYHILVNTGTINTIQVSREAESNFLSSENRC